MLRRVSTAAACSAFPSSLHLPTYMLFVSFLTATLFLFEVTIIQVRHVASLGVFGVIAFYVAAFLPSPLLCPARPAAVCSAFIWAHCALLPAISCLLPASFFASHVATDDKSDSQCCLSCSSRTWYGQSPSSYPSVCRNPRGTFLLKRVSRICALAT